MAITKYPLARYKVLDRCFRNPYKKYFIEDLIEACSEALSDMPSKNKGVSRRTILSDISHMESAAGWSIDLLRLTDGKRVYYRYADPEFSINNMPLNEVELNQLQSAMELLGYFEGMPQFEWVSEIMPKLQQGAMPERTSPVISFDANRYLKGIDFLGPLFNAITHRRVLEISYRDFKAEEPYRLELHPYYLKQFNNRWYVLGYNPHDGRNNWILALDRIVAISEIKGKYKPNKEIDWEAYFEDIVGVTLPENGKPEKIELQFVPDTAQYILTKPLHGSQKKVKLDENGLRVSLELIINREFESLVLSFGERVKVLKPAGFKRTIKEKLAQALAQY